MTFNPLATHKNPLISLRCRAHFIYAYTSHLYEHIILLYRAATKSLQDIQYATHIVCIIALVQYTCCLSLYPHIYKKYNNIVHARIINNLRAFRLYRGIYFIYQGVENVRAQRKHIGEDGATHIREQKSNSHKLKHTYIWAKNIYMYMYRSGCDKVKLPLDCVLIYDTVTMSLCSICQIAVAKSKCERFAFKEKGGSSYIYICILYSAAH